MVGGYKKEKQSNKLDIIHVTKAHGSLQQVGGYSAPT
jgi:hypothetical protein